MFLLNINIKYGENSNNSLCFLRTNHFSTKANQFLYCHLQGLSIILLFWSTICG